MPDRHKPNPKGDPINKELRRTADELHAESKRLRAQSEALRQRAEAIRKAIAKRDKS